MLTAVLRNLLPYHVVMLITRWIGILKAQIVGSKLPKKHQLMTLRPKRSAIQKQQLIARGFRSSDHGHTAPTGGGGGGVPPRGSDST
jgi:hypothetical protein